MGLLRSVARIGVACATVAAAKEIHHDVKKSEKKAKKAEKKAKEAQEDLKKQQAAAAAGAAYGAHGTMAPVKPVMYHVNLMSCRVPVSAPGYPNYGAISIYYDQAMGGWRAAPRGTRPTSCENRSAHHSFATLPHYVAFSVVDSNGQASVLFSDKSCSVCGEHAILTAQQVPYQQIVAMSHPQVLNEAGFQGAPGMVPPPPAPGMCPPPDLAVTQQYPAGPVPPTMEPPRDANPMYSGQPQPQPQGGVVPPPM